MSPYSSGDQLIHRGYLWVHTATGEQLIHREYPWVLTAQVSSWYTGGSHGSHCYRWATDTQGIPMGSYCYKWSADTQGILMSPYCYRWALIHRGYPWVLTAQVISWYTGGTHGSLLLQVISWVHRGYWWVHTTTGEQLIQRGYPWVLAARVSSWYTGGTHGSLLLQVSSWHRRVHVIDIALPCVRFLFSSMLIRVCLMPVSGTFTYAAPQGWVPFHRFP